MFTGIRLDTTGDRVIVWRKPEATFDAKIRAIGGARVELRSAPRSLSEMQSLQRTVISFSATHNIAVVAISLPTDGMALTVKISSDLKAGRTALTAKFGTTVRVAAGEWADGL